MTVQLFIKKVPSVIKELILREAEDNHRSMNQEAIALLEEALVRRVVSPGQKRRSVHSLLMDYAARSQNSEFNEGYADSE